MLEWKKINKGSFDIYGAFFNGKRVCNINYSGISSDWCFGSRKDHLYFTSDKRFETLVAAQNYFEDRWQAWLDHAGLQMKESDHD